jgi:hypothetical protein
MQRIFKGGLQLPKFRPTAKQQHWIASERRTANFIRALWKASGQEQRKDPTFLCLLVQLGWNNGQAKTDSRPWRNRKIADYLHIPHGSDRQLAEALHSKFISLTTLQCRAMLKDQTGITGYHTAFRPATLKFVTEHSESIALAFKQVSTTSKNVYEKVSCVAELIDNLGAFHVADKSIDPFKGLTPVLSCLDPQHRFPIMNKLNRPLLKYIGMNTDKDGIVALSKLIGPIYKISDARELDVYTSSIKFPRRPKITTLHTKDGFPEIGLKSEINGIAHIAAKKATITKLHNQLINRLNEYLLWRHITAKESEFDAFIIGWSGRRDLLIEAKTASEGTSGRTQIRQAIGQLYDYRFRLKRNNPIDLAILLPEEPNSDIKGLLYSLGIELLWFNGKKLTGTVKL